jgi:small subunit ribosomal protein S28e
MEAEPIPVRIVEVITRTGIHGEANQVMCKVLDGKDKGRVIRRNVKGPVKAGDIILLLETERESKEIKAR